MYAQDFLNWMRANSISPVKEVKAAHSSDTPLYLEPKFAVNHGFTYAVIMVSTSCEFDSWPEGTHDGIRDSAGSRMISGPKRFYFRVKDLEDAGLLELLQQLQTK